jgi:hypothetical protein
VAIPAAGWQFQQWNDGSTDAIRSITVPEGNTIYTASFAKIPAPTITSGTSSTGTVGQAYSYNIIGSNVPINYSATNLPAWLNIDPASGVISGTPTNAGQFNITINATNNGGTSPTATLTLTITPAMANVTLGNLTQIYNGSAESVVAATTPAGLAVTLTYNGSATAPTNAGNYTVAATVNDPNYTGTATDTLTITQAPANVTLFNLAQTYNGSAEPVTTTTNPPGLTVNLTYNGGSIPPTNAGNYSVFATVNDPNYVGSATGTLVVAKALAAVNLTGLTQTYNGTMEFASAITSPPGLVINITYNGNTALPTNAGSYTVVATVNDPNYTGTATDTLIISSAAQIITFGNLSTQLVTDAPFILGATASSSLPVNYTSSNTSVATVSGNTVTILATGNTTITASQPGDQDYQAALDVGQLLVVDELPSFITQPEDSTVTAGQDTSFTVAANGVPAPALQWQISNDGGITWSNLTDDNGISGSANMTLTVSNTTATMSGNQFRVLISNTVGSAPSNAATLTVDTVPLIAKQPISPAPVIAGDSTTFTAEASGSPTPTFQWQLSTDTGVTWGNLTDGNGISGSTSTTLTVTTTTAMSENQFRLVATNPAGVATSNAATLTVTFAPIITTPPISTLALVGQPAVFTVIATGNPAPTCQWQFNGKPISGATSDAYTIGKVTAANTGNYAVVVSNGIGSPATSVSATLSLGKAAVITASPANVTVDVGQAALFKVVATGTPAPTIQWQMSSDSGASWVNISVGNFTGFTSGNLTVSNISVSQSGAQFRAVATNTIGISTYSATSKSALLSVNSPASIVGLSAISGNQAINGLAGGNLSVATGGNVILSVAGTGNALKYQWQLNGKNISGATKASYSIVKATLANAGNYTVVVSNALNKLPLPSNAITLTVLTKPSITTQPRAQSAKAGATVTFTVVAAGTAPLTFVWNWNGGGLPSNSSTAVISGSATTTATLTLTKVTSGDNGSYQVTISNAQGSLPSASAKLTVK